MKILLSVLLALVFVSNELCAEKELINGNNQFSIDLYKQLRSEKDNLFFSPYSISSAFAMTAVGARGQTAKEMEAVFHFSPEMFSGFRQLNKQLITTAEPRTGSPTLQIANAIWPQKGLQLLSPFKNVLQKDFGSSIESVDFIHNTDGAINIINKWVSENTKGKIPNLLNSGNVTSETKLILTSAIYMKAAWMNVFDEYGTQKAPFHIDLQNSIDTSMMHVTEHFYLYDDAEVAVIKMPYVYDSSGPVLVMMVALPKEINGLSRLEENLSYQKWTNWVTKGERRRMHVSFPKFKIENRMSLNNTMSVMGLKQAFSRQADFSGITGKPDLYISEAIHQTYIDVDEKGTEAAAVTAIGMRATSIVIPEEPHEFNADHPFMFLIMDQKTQTILFMGRFLKPT